MIHAEARKKLVLSNDDDSEYPITLYEDATTSAFFERVSYFPDEVVLEVLRTYFPNLASSTRPIVFEFWPHVSTGEPDLVITGSDWILIVEAKFGSPLSGEDQLGKYVHSYCTNPAVPQKVGILFITSDFAEPRLEYGKDEGENTAREGADVDAFVRRYLASKTVFDEKAFIGGKWTSWIEFGERLDKTAKAHPARNDSWNRLLGDIKLLLKTRSMVRWTFDFSLLIDRTDKTSLSGLIEKLGSWISIISGDLNAKRLKDQVKVFRSIDSSALHSWMKPAD